GRRDHVGRDAVHADHPVPQFERQALREAGDGRLHGRVHGVPGRGAMGLDGGQVHDGTAGLRNERHNTSDEMRDADEGLAHERVLALGVHVEEGGVEAAAGVVDEYVDVVELLAHDVEEAVDLVRLADVELGGNDTSAGRLDRVGGPVQVLDVTVAG